MRIIASAGSPNGWLEAMGYSGPLPSAIFDGEMLSGWYLGTITFPDIKIPVDSDEIFVALQIDNRNFSYGNWGGTLGRVTDIVNNSSASEDKVNQRIFRILNSDGQQIASFGMLTAGNYVWVNEAMGIHSYETASPKSPKNSAGGKTDNGVIPLVSPGGRGVFLHYKYDRADPTKSFFRYYWGTKLIAELTGSQLTSAANGAPAYFTVFSGRPERNGSSRGVNIRSMVIADSMDFTLKVVNARPVTLNNASQWTGAVANLQEWLQAKTYLATAIEANASFDVNMALNTSEISAMSTNTPGAAQVLSLKTFLGARYVQSGGVSATFRIELFKSGVAYGSPVDVVIPANEDNTTFLTKKIMSLIPTELLLVKDIVDLSIKLTLVG